MGRIAFRGVRISSSIVALAGWCAVGWAETRLTSVQIASGFSQPLFATAPPGDTSRLFVVEQVTARIRVIDLTTGQIRPRPFLDIDPLVSNSDNESGLLGMAFDPNYATTGHFFVHYSDNADDTVVARYRVQPGNPDEADPNSAKIILWQDQPFLNHNGGMIAFSPLDGYFYFGLGDGGGSFDPQGNAQNLATWLGKMLRLDVHVDPQPYVVPPDNPFVGDPNARPEIWSLGLRNPFRFSFDRANGDLYIGDVGQREREEVNYRPATSRGGENYGWRCMEGFRCTGQTGCTCNDPALTNPVRDHIRSEAACVIGGYVYRGRKMPDLRGTYFYADWSTNNLWSFRMVNGVDTNFKNRTAELQPPDGGLSGITSFGEDAEGEIYVVARNGRIFRIVPNGLAVGDMNGDGWVDAFDIEPFALALFDRPAYQQRYPGIDPDVTGDINGDGLLNAFDIEPFVELLFE